MDFVFGWDEVKAEQNVRKHRVSFEEAVTIFSDPYLITFPDDEHSDVEDRFISIGQSDNGPILLVVHTDHHDTIRLISCRKATRAERRIYEQ
ncbi:MAG: BrnT family toxin [Caldilineaceae bacterium]|nr:BrnT family toxin [Caldilineaceae bacterium]